MARCGCASDRCACVVVQGDGIEVTGVGTESDPYVVENTFVAAPIEIIEGPIPAGFIFTSATIAIPSGWLDCDGSERSRATYPGLFAAIGTTFGVGDGTTTFNLPDLRDKVAVGASTTKPLGDTGGADTKTIGVTNLPVHNHAIDHNHAAYTTASGGTHAHLIRVTDRPACDTTGTCTTSYLGSPPAERVALGNQSGGSTPVDAFAVGSDGAHTHSVDVPNFSGTSGSTGSGTPLNVQNAYTALRHLIKT